MKHFNTIVFGIMGLISLIFVKNNVSQKSNNETKSSSRQKFVDFIPRDHIVEEETDEKVIHQDGG